MTEVALKSKNDLKTLGWWNEEYATTVLKVIEKQHFMKSKKRAWEHLTLYGIDLAANGIDIKKNCLEQMWDLLQKERDFWQHEEDVEEDGEGDTSRKRGGVASVAAGSRADDENLVSGAENGRKKKRPKKGSGGDQDGK